jgi:hypothetical protein
MAVGLLLLTALAGAFLARESAPEPRFTTDVCSSIRAGMTRADVDAILGPCCEKKDLADLRAENLASGWGAFGRQVAVIRDKQLDGQAETVSSSYWVSGDNWAAVDFSADGKAIAIAFGQFPRNTPFARFRRALGL